MSHVTHQWRACHRHALVLVAIVVGGSLVTACSPDNAAAQQEPTSGMSLAECRTYGLASAPATLRLPGMVFFGAASIQARAADDSASEALVAFSKDRRVGAILFDGPASTSPPRVQDWMWNANIAESSKWDVDIVDKEAIIISPVADTANATDVSHSTFTTHHRENSATFDYWAFTANSQRYLLSYARYPTAKVPDAATFFATATSCPKPKPTK